MGEAWGTVGKSRVEAKEAKEALWRDGVAIAGAEDKPGPGDRVGSH